MDKVVLLKCEDYGDIVQEKVDEIFECFGGIENILSKGQKVVLKVNLVCGATPDRNCTTHPSVVMAVAKRVLEYGCECIIADSPGGPFNALHLKSVYAKSGMTGILEKLPEIKLNNDFSTQIIFNENNEVLKEFEIMKVLFDADVIFNLSKFKAHTYMGFTGAVKNMFGVIPGLVKVEMHSRFVGQDVFSKMLIDINQTLREKTKLNITDAVWGMEGQGPTGGDSIKVGYLMAGQNPYALDLAQAKLMSKDINQFPLILQMQKKGLINADFAINLVGDFDSINTLSRYNIPKCEQYNALKKAIPPFLQPFFHKLMTRRPVIKKRKCRGCAKCYEHCPVKAITMCRTKKNKRYAKIDYQKCIRCFCCQELCPFHIVKIKTGILHKIIRLKPNTK